MELRLNIPNMRNMQQQLARDFQVELFVLRVEYLLQAFACEALRRSKEVFNPNTTTKTERTILRCSVAEFIHFQGELKNA
jgi:hypothetical protein